MRQSRTATGQRFVFARAPCRSKVSSSRACTDELDSYMYQTVGNSAVAAIAESLGVPLVSRAIEGASLVLSNEYGRRLGRAARERQERADSTEESESDEAEDLFLLLREVKVRFSSSRPRHGADAYGCAGALPRGRGRLMRRDPVQLPAHPCRACVSTLAVRSRTCVRDSCEHPPQLLETGPHGGGVPLGTGPSRAVAVHDPRGSRGALDQSCWCRVRPCTTLVRARADGATCSLRVRHLGKTLGEMEPTLMDLVSFLLLKIAFSMLTAANLAAQQV